jgi:hypothetical protein
LPTRVGSDDSVSLQAIGRGSALVVSDIYQATGFIR